MASHCGMVREDHGMRRDSWIRLLKIVVEELRECLKGMPEAFYIRCCECVHPIISINIDTVNQLSIIHYSSISSIIISLSRHPNSGNITTLCFQTTQTSNHTTSLD